MSRKFSLSSLATLLLVLLALFIAPPIMADEDDPDNGPPPHAGPPGGDGPPGLATPPGRGNPPDRQGPPEDRGPPGDRGPRFGNGPDAGPPSGIPDFCTPRRPAGRGEGPAGQAGLSSIALLDFSGDNGSGKLVYRWIAPLFDFVFNARGLEPGQDYTLVYLGSPVICLGSGTSTEGGTLHIQDALDIGTDLPANGDEGEVATLALIVGEECADSPAVLIADDGMFYVRYVEDDDSEEDDGDD